MNVTLSVMKADVGSVGGHLAPAPELVRAVRDRVERSAPGALLDFVVSHTGDDIALLMTHRRGTGDVQVHRIARAAFLAALRVARAAGLYDPGPLATGDHAGAPVIAAAEMELAERAAEPFVLLATDKTGPGAFNLPLYLAFADPLNTPGLIVSPEVAVGFRFVISDLAAGGDRVVELVTPEELYDLAALLSRPARFVVESVWSRATHEQAAVVASARLRDDGAGHPAGDPVMLVRCEHAFPGIGDLLAPFQLVGHVMGGPMQSALLHPLMPVPLGSGVSYSEGPPVVTAAAYSMKDGRLTGPVDPFAHPFWDVVRQRLANNVLELHRHGFFGAARFPLNEREAVAFEDKLHRLDDRFRARRSGEPEPACRAVDVDVDVEVDAGASR